MNEARPNASRRALLALGAGAALALAVAGGGAWLWRPGFGGGRLTPDGRAVFRAVARVVLEGSLPEEADARERALDAHLGQLELVVAGLPPPTRSELSRLLALLSVAPGRRWLTGLRADWGEASVQEVEAALRRMRAGADSLRQQAYHALRDLTNAAFYGRPESWPLLGYPGPAPV